MPDANPITEHWRTELQIYYQNLLLVQEQMNAEPIHDLRVAIKKLRSYVQLYAVLFEKKDAEEIFAKTKELFSVLGKYRNVEITRQLVFSFYNNKEGVLNSLFVYLQLLQDQIGDYCRQVLQRFKETGLDEMTKLLEKDFENFNPEANAEKIKNVVASSMKKVEKSLKHFKNKSHLTRKHLKDIFYWAKIFPDDFIFTKPQLKTLSRILDHLGNVQDHEMMITNLKNFRKTVLFSSLVEYDLIKKIETKAEKKKNRFLEKANKMTEELLIKTGPE